MSCLSLEDKLRRHTRPRTPDRPHFVVIMVDHFGNGDLGCFGSTLHRTPHVDRMAVEGTKFTSFYVTVRETREISADHPS